MFIIDFDDTLFNTRPGFKEARIAAVARLDISPEVYQETYGQARRTPEGIASYSNYRHAQILGTKGFDEAAVRAALETTTTPEKLRDLLYPEAHEFLQKLKKLGEPLVLLSLGDAEFQNLKVQGTGIAPYFERIFVVDDTKEHVVRKLLEHVTDSTIWFINDWVTQTMELALKFPSVRFVLKQSPTGGTDEEYTKSGLPYFKTLTEIYDYIAKQSK